MIIIISTIKYGSTYYNTFTMGVSSNYHGYFFQWSVSIELIAGSTKMTNKIVRDIPRTFLERALGYYFFLKSITSKEYHL